MLIVFSITGVFCSFLLYLLSGVWVRYYTIRKAKNIAMDIMQGATDKAISLKEQTELQVQDDEMILKVKSDQIADQLRDKVRDLQSYNDTLRYKNHLQWMHVTDSLNQEQDKVLKLKKEWEKKLSDIHEFTEQYKQKRKEYATYLSGRFSMNQNRIKTEIEQKEIQKVQLISQKKMEQIMEDIKINADKNATLILDRALSRFCIPCCQERGISAVVLKSIQAFRGVIGLNQVHLNLIQEQCGVDIVTDQKNLSFVVQGLDSVRREWGRLTLLKLSKKKRVNRAVALSVINQSKRELFRKIKQDGQRICNSLRLKNVATEICNMMGALRYRYSFAQNQHFHCEEVGFLCGLLVSELGGSVDTGKRSGLFHDIGKAMDHSKEGGHAMIGADFIKEHGEHSSIVYAVRAHHHDVTPKSPIDFLVIASDAISGSRPGARRSTADSYNQKILSLEKIGKGFKGVKDVYIMNSGRDMRVTVDSKRVNDQDALRLSKDIAQKIEMECSYPGWIKVMVVRKVESHQSTSLAK